MGKSDDVSRNYGTFKTSLEKMRNDSLRLNKGVQTEGDAVRAWNELFENLNDEQYVLQRLKEIQKTNARAADLKKLQVDQIRGNFNADPLDYSQYDSSPAILDQPAKNAGGNVISYEDYFK